MKKISFVGAYDKTDLMMYTAKALKDMGSKVLVIDGTMLQKTRYTVPSITQTKMYVTEFEQIDFAVGFQGIGQIVQYLKLNITTEKELPYDYVLIDIDNRMSLKTFGTKTSEQIYFVTGFDIYSLKRGIDILRNLEDTMHLTKILYSNNVTKEDEDYLNYLSLEQKVEWDDMVLYFPVNEMDNKIIEENQRVDKIRIKRLSKNYQQSIIYVVQNITGDNTGNIKRNIVE